MPDARALRDIESELRTMMDRAGAAGSSRLRACLATVIPVAREEAERAEQERQGRALRPAGILRRLGEG